ncbi:hypothetical protein AB0C04_16365 [Micromonospora sp. NPDC048909]|uniref:RICIN domain-containing protein n=1 Tax=Micromonospora sp. NPDC048909 TaxID=3155643 RepID=UPI0033C19175
MADPDDDLKAIADLVRHATRLPPAQTVRRRSDERRRRRVSVAGAGLAVLLVTGGVTLAQARDRFETPEREVAPAVEASPSVVPSATASAGPQEILDGRRQVRIVVPGLSGAPLAIGRDDDRVRASTEPGVDDRALWILRPEDGGFRIVLATPHVAGQLCMTVVHDTAPGSVRGRVCDRSVQAQLFKIDQVADGSYSIFQGKRYVQVVDGTNALVPDLPEGLTTTYEFEDGGPADAAGGTSSPIR